VWLGIRAQGSLVAATGGVHWAASRLSGVAIRHWHQGLEWRLGRAPWFALGAHLSIYQLLAGPGMSPTSSTTYDPAVSLRGGIATPIAKQPLQAAMGLWLQPGHPIVINGQAAFSLPSLALSADIVYEFEL
jgi:hypothetical protein